MNKNTPEQPQAEDSLRRDQASEDLLEAMGDESPSINEASNQTTESSNPENSLDQEDESNDFSNEQDEFGDIDEDYELEADSQEPSEESDDPWASVIEIGGDKRTARDWHTGFLKNKDYTQKTQKLAEQRKDMEQREVGLSQLQEQSAMALGLLTKQAQADVEQYRNVDWNKLLDSDHTKYMKHKAKYDSAKDKLQSIHGEAQTFFGNIEQVNQQRKQQLAQSCVVELKKDVKGWSDDYYSKVLDYGISKGVDETFLSSCTDPKIIKMLIKAQKYDNMRATAKEKRNAPRKVMAASRTQLSKIDKSTVETAIDRLKSTNSKHDATDAFFEILKE